MEAGIIKDGNKERHAAYNERDGEKMKLIFFPWAPSGVCIADH